MTDTQFDPAERVRNADEKERNFADSIAAHRAALEETYHALFDIHRATIEQNKYPYKMPTNFERWIK